MLITRQMCILQTDLQITENNYHLWNLRLDHVTSLHEGSTFYRPENTSRILCYNGIC